MTASSRPPMRSRRASPPSEASPLRRLDPDAISRRARKESRNREIHLPPVSTFRWWARRTGAVNYALVEAVEADRETPMLVADPFAGGGVIPLAAVTRGHQVYAQDLNPWAARGLAAMMALPAPDELREGQRVVGERMAPMLEKAYTTQLPSEERAAQVSHTFRVATADCPGCRRSMRLFPYAMVSLLERKERGKTACFLACARGHLFRGDSEAGGTCPDCGQDVDPAERYTGQRWVTCPKCSHQSKLDELARSGTWGWEVVLLERATEGERTLGTPTDADLERADCARWQPERSLGAIPEGQETSVLLRHGFTAWEQLYPCRQRVVLERLLAAIDDELEGPTRAALRMAALGTTEMAGLLSRWDRWYLKSYEGMANHRFNFTTFTAEPNVWGCEISGRGTFIRRVHQLIRASEWLETETETQRHFTVEGPLDSEHRRTRMRQDLDVRVVEGSSERIVLPQNSIDLVLTDPPYHDDVQYGELSLPFRVWAGQSTSELEGEAVVNGATDKNRDADYRELLARIFSEVHRALKDDGHLIFSYANREPGAWADIFWALQEAGLVAAGCEVLHAENETDLAKRGVRACTLDLILDLVPEEQEPATIWVPESFPDDPEGAFLREVAAVFTKIGSLEADWEEDFAETLEGTAFLADT